ncbi:acyl-CoA dehydrogenase [Hanamia caeni]|uniref:Acyl-CoA dehydrogenase n=1 Tax=Hanamia caeni TaxID=2294116 RepID=A0A3M9NR55_9BACT|nr:acyl-CoA dehydrogenase family protein [Hanamia caeni]RNI40174.1 acyl-CoA dehydrogenase [Hanamia caeni]
MKSEFTDYLEDYKKVLKEVFEKKFGGNEFTIERALSPDELNKIMEARPLAVAIPEKYGGRGVKVKECLGILSAASYESISLSLMFGINIALFLEPVAKYANESVKEAIFKNFLEKQNMGGLMITEPDFGSDALNMHTWNERVGDSYKVKGIKHWQGLTGIADYWLITSREKNANGELNRDIDFFICDVSKERQQIVVEQVYNNLGLELIPYGRNRVDILVPEQNKLVPQTSGLKMMLDILHRSRLQFPGMAMGFIKRMLDEALQQCNQRIVGGKKLIELDEVQYQVSQIQSAFTVVSAMCFRSSYVSGIEHDLSAEGIEANSMKAYITDLMQESSQTYTQLSGANGYRISNIGGRGIMDSRAFQIFEGSNEMLYTQIGEMIAKLMKRKKESNIYRFLKEFNLTQKACSFFKKDIDFNLAAGISQRKMIDLGKVFSRIIASNFVIEMGEKGFRNDLVTNCINMIKADVSTLISSFHAENTVTPVENYKEKSQWFDLV